jgi:hypothetical protein
MKKCEAIASPTLKASTIAPPAFHAAKFGIEVPPYAIQGQQPDKVGPAQLSYLRYDNFLVAIQMQSSGTATIRSDYSPISSSNTLGSGGDRIGRLSNANQSPLTEGAMSVTTQ